MARWIRCTDLTNGTIFVNFDNIICIREGEKDGSKLSYLGSKDQHIYVKETPDTLVSLAQ